MARVVLARALVITRPGELMAEGRAASQSSQFHRQVTRQREARRERVAAVARLPVTGRSQSQASRAITAQHISHTNNTDGESNEDQI